MASDIRIDKWLWAVRLFKTRTLASDACKRGHVMVDNVVVKSSKVLKIGDVVQLKKNPVVFSFKVIGIPSSRVGAKLVSEYMQQVTTADQLHLWEMLKLDMRNARAKGLGRPTKKERRSLDSFIEDTPYYVDEEVEDEGFDEMFFDE